MDTKKLIDKPNADLLNAWAYLMSIYLVWFFREKGLHIVYQKEIEEYLKYQDQKKFSKMIEKIIRSEMDKFHITPKEIEDIVKKVVKEPEYKIIYVTEVNNALGV